MGSQKQKGFTIIEVILFLAVSALLLSALLVGINTSINQQRYKDSVNSLIGLIQEQYTLTANVNNQRDTNWTCDTAAPTVTTVSGESRGTTECVIVGRLVQIKDGVTISTSNIVAYNINDDLLQKSSSDIQALTDGADLIALSDTESATSTEVTAREINWGSKAKILNKDGDITGDSFTLAIIRSPVTGTVSSFVVNEVTVDWKGKIITQDSRDRSLIACVTSPSPIAGAQMAVMVTAGSSNSGGVYQRAEVAGC